MQNLGISVIFQGNNLLRLLSALMVTLKISMISALLSLFLGAILGMLMTLNNSVIKILSRLYLETVRIMPQLVLLFIVYFGSTKIFNLNISGEMSSIIVFTFWGTAEISDLVRGAIISVPVHQFESGRALGLTTFQLYMYIILPQTIRHLLPNAINLITRMIKTTSLIALIGVIEVLKVGQQIIESYRFTNPNAALWVYGFIFLLYFAVCYPISLLAKYLEKRR